MLKKSEYTTRVSCRVCNSEDLSDIYSFGHFFISSFVESENEDVGLAPLDLIQCNTCTLVQLRHTAPQEILYSRKYWYRSGINEKIKNDLKEIAQDAIKISGIKDDEMFLDIGANDGTLLSFVPVKERRLAVEPAKNLHEDLAKHAAVIDDFWEHVDRLPWGRQAKVITAIGMFYDSENPNNFINNVKRHLAPGGLFISQMMMLRPMLEKNDLGNICHEHLEYYNYASLKRLFEQNGLEIFRVEENDINGGSYRIFARYYDKGSIDYQEPEPSFETFIDGVKKNRDQVKSFIEQEVKEGKKVYGYGASTKGNTILQFYGLGSDLITGISDRNPEKIGKFTVGTNIPIVSEEEARVADYFLVLPWGFLENFKEREKDWQAKGGKFITHTPNFSV